MASSYASDGCFSVECNIKCFTDGIGDCHHLDQNIPFDTAVVKVASRAACQNPKVFISAIQNCKVKEVSCHVIMMTTMTDAQLYLDEQNFAQYKSKLCRYVILKNIKITIFNYCVCRTNLFKKTFFFCKTGYKTIIY